MINRKADTYFNHYVWFVEIFIVDKILSLGTEEQGLFGQLFKIRFILPGNFWSHHLLNKNRRWKKKKMYDKGGGVEEERKKQKGKEKGGRGK